MTRFEAPTLTAAMVFISVTAVLLANNHVNTLDLLKLEKQRPVLRDDCHFGVVDGSYRLNVLISLNDSTHLELSWVSNQLRVRHICRQHETLLLLHEFNMSSQHRHCISATFTRQIRFINKVQSGLNYSETFELE